MRAPVPDNEAERLVSLRSLNILDTAPELAFDELTSLAASVCQAPVALISLVEADRQCFKSRFGCATAETPRDISFCAHTILEPDLLVVSDATADLVFTAALAGTQQVPPNDSPATGSALLMLSPDQTSLSFAITFANLESPPMAAHLHNAPAGQNGPVVADAEGAPQTFTVNDMFVSQLLQGNIYANIHTASFPEGEIRGQFALANGAFADLGGNLVGIGGPGSGNLGFTNPATQTGTMDSPLDPLLGLLQNNGGPAIGDLGHTMSVQTELLLKAAGPSARASCPELRPAMSAAS
jgi:hypothetical protein